MIKKSYLGLIAFILLAGLIGCSTNKEQVSSSVPVVYDINPISKNGTIVENISATEVMVEAYGIYYGQGNSDGAKKNDVDKNGAEKALIDARKTALYTLLFGSSDPLIKTDGEKSNFNKNANYMYSDIVLNSVITYEDSMFKSVIKINEGAGIKVSKNFRVNRSLLEKELVNKGIIKALDEILESVGNPIIMVIPNAAKGENPVDILLNDSEKRQIATVIQSYLTSRGYEVIVPEQKNLLDDLSSTTLMVQGEEPDYAYELALSIGSDVYISFTGTLEDADFGTSRYSMALSAFESTTARLLGSETGFSQGRKGDVNVSIEESVNSSISSLLGKVSSYWKDDQKKGVQYKILVTLPSYLDSSQVDDVHLGFLDTVDAVAISSREMILTPQTIDYIIWVDPEKYDRGLRLYNALREEFQGSQSTGILSRISINRKFIHLKVEE